jgi:hypothetical protein
MDVAPERLERLLTKYELPYPVGLFDQNAGIYVASPTPPNHAADYQTFGRGHYHGTVVWAWQNSLLTRGLMRQLRHLRTSKGAVRARIWCSPSRR